MTTSHRRICIQCSGPMPAMHRADRLHCSRACEAKAYRARKRSAVPPELTSRDRWVRHTARKMPLTVAGRAASSTDPATWSTYSAALASTVGVGLGFVLDGDGIACIDLDHALDDQGQQLPWAKRILDLLPATYIEVSRSGQGLHIFGLAPAGPGRNVRRGEVAVEVYTQGRYIAMGRRFGNAPSKLADLPLDDLLKAVDALT